MHSHMDFECHCAQVAQSEAFSLLNEMLSVLTKIQVIRGLLLDPLNLFDGEPPTLK
jgi:hypothetical protein